jgi:uroporphyrinogen decarboxylase
MTELTSHDRVKRMFEHRDADRVPITDWIWESTWLRWLREGMPAGPQAFGFLGLDHVASLGIADIDTSPRFERILVEETESYRIERNQWGVTVKNFKPMTSTPQDLSFEIRDPDTWRKAKERMAPARDRVNWGRLQSEYRGWREHGYWVAVAPWFGFDIVSTRMVGTERTLLALGEEPEWCLDMFTSLLDLALALLEMIWAEGYIFDELLWFDDMAYRNGPFMSMRMYRELLKPYQQRVIDWCHAHAIKAHLHCCGNATALIPELVSMGLDALHPLEVKAGMDPVSVKREHGNDLVLHGGFDVRNWVDTEKAESEIRAKLPTLKENGGYIFSSDHSIPDNVSLDNYRRIVALVKEVGVY